MNSRLPKKQLPVLGDRLHRGSSLFGLKFLFLIVACAVLILLMSPSLESVEQQENTETADMPIASGGYSIFHETMVDMNWPDVESAAEQGAVILLPTAVIE